MLLNKINAFCFTLFFFNFQHLNATLPTTQYPYIEFEFRGHIFKFYDSHQESRALKLVLAEITSNFYTPTQIDFQPNDIMIDIGAHVGMISILYAKLHPLITIYAYEPIPDNFALLLKNLELNNIKNVKTFNMAVTGDGRPIQMALHYDNTGAATQCYFNIKSGDKIFSKIPSQTLDNIFNEHNIKLCKLLKIDCEGSEYEILFNTSKIKFIQNLIGEFHTNNYLINKGYSSLLLENYLIKNGIRVNIDTVHIREF